MGAENLKCVFADGMVTQFASFPGAGGVYTCNLIPDVEYANYDGRSMKLQIIKPEREDKRFPLVVYVKGSSWLKQKQYKNIPKLVDLAQHGYVIAQVEYRESPEGSYADKVADTKAAIRFMRRHAEEYCVDVERVALFGDSSGGHIALMSAMTPGQYNNGLYGDQREDVKCVVDYYGVTDIVSLICDFYHRSVEEACEYFNTTFFAGKAHGDIVKMTNEISPIYNVPADKPLPPMLIVHGDADRIVGFDQSARFAKVLQENGHKVYLYKVAGADHDIGVWGPERSQLVAEFLDAHML